MVGPVVLKPEVSADDELAQKGPLVGSFSSVRVRRVGPLSGSRRDVPFRKRVGIAFFSRVVSLSHECLFFLWADLFSGRAAPSEK